MPDDDGKPYRVAGNGPTSRPMGLVNLFDPAATTWFKDVLKDMLRLGFKGWVHGLGDGLPADAVRGPGFSGLSLHNRYAVAWAKLAREVQDELVAEDAKRFGDLCFFTTAGFTQSGHYSTQEWLEADGSALAFAQPGRPKYGPGASKAADCIKSATVIAPLAAGLVGRQCSAGIGTDTAILSGKTVRPDREALLRWTAANTFGNLLRTVTPNQNGSPVKDDLALGNDPTTLAEFARFAKIYSALGPYRQKLQAEMANTGRPVVRHMMLEFQGDPMATELEDQYMLGSELLVAPVLYAGDRSREVYLPAGEWVDLWSGHACSSTGLVIKVNAPLDRIPVYFRKGSADGEALRAELVRQGLASPAI
jgi:alpha-glucosidase